MRLLVLGASGQVGGCLMQAGRAAGHDMVGTRRSTPRPGLRPLDLTGATATAALVGEIRPDVILHCAAWAWVDGNEQDPARARRENVDAVRHAIDAAADTGSRYVFFSSAYVFDGRKPEPYTEDDPVSPVSVYGAAKANGEVMCRARLGPRALVLRTTWVYGPEAQGKNFAYQVVAAGRGGRPLAVPADQLGNPTYGPDLAAATLSLLDRGASGIWHVAGPEAAMDRGTFARGICRAVGLDAGFLRLVTTAALGQPAARPLNGGLATDRLREAGISMRPLARALEDWRREGLAWPGG